MNSIYKCSICSNHHKRVLTGNLFEVKIHFVPGFKSYQQTICNFKSPLPVDILGIIGEFTALYCILPKCWICLYYHIFLTKLNHRNKYKKPELIKKKNFH